MEQDKDRFQRLSIVIPVFNEAKSLNALFERLKDVALDIEKEIILVDDCSSDGTGDLIRTLEDGQVKKIFHEKTWGKARRCDPASLPRAISC